MSMILAMGINRDVPSKSPRLVSRKVRQNKRFERSMSVIPAFPFNGHLPSIPPRLPGGYLPLARPFLSDFKWFDALRRVTQVAALLRHLRGTRSA